MPVERLAFAKDTFDLWLAGLDATDHLMMMAAGVGLIVLAGAALLLQRRPAAPSAALRRGTFADSAPRHLPGERHMVAPKKTGRKDDAFLSRLDRLA
ncbi:hypothetical protein [Celeribacter indicus]|uniref:Uncharacterized protein n=1 Tax=Celeribacter indicus TaxID=1208324 RepID=A0A0B5DXG9_9RHOB|nr:hypothetical protein [Celeribacter indicus]AJE45451.1 hypothetical protein P73_0736 [Celeribacter indicus]SDX02321.1 hypothetical protein SAMN05443573_111118 [Celeribacter indicus]